MKVVVAVMMAFLVAIALGAFLPVKGSRGKDDGTTGGGSRSGEKDLGTE